MIVGCMKAINGALNNSAILATEAVWIHEVSRCTEKLHGSVSGEILRGICGNRDGFIVQIAEPVESD